MSEKNKLIEKLEAISILHQRAVSIREKMNDYIPEDNYERKIILPLFPGEYSNEEEREYLKESVDHSDYDAVETMGNVYDSSYAPKKPAEPKIKDFEYRMSSESKNMLDKLGCFSYIAVAVSGFFLLSLLLGTADGAKTTIVIIAIIAAIAFGYLRYMINNKRKEENGKEADALGVYNEEKDAIFEKYQEDLKKYENDCVAYAAERKEFLNEYEKWREVYLESQEEESEIDEKLEADRLAVVKKIETEEFTPVAEDLVVLNDIVALEYLPVLDDIIDLLKSGRADDFKEAVNLYEDIVYRERQLELEMEKEEQRRYEAEREREDRLRYEQQELELKNKELRQQADQFKQQQEQAAKQHAENMKKQEKMEEEAKRAADKRCHYCAKWDKCNLRVNPPLNCSAYEPGSGYQF